MLSQTQAAKPSHRMFVDEVGHADMKASADPNQRFLSLTGVIVSLGHYASVIAPQMAQLKTQTFGSPSVVLHRSELTRQSPPFDALKEPEIRRQFDCSILRLLMDFEYTVLTATIDKLEHQNRYRVWRAHPYHYCLECVMERYVKWLERNRATGDVVAEARGKREDKKLKESYGRLYSQGSRFVNKDRFKAVLSSGQLKLKAKHANIVGLQIADLIAHPSFRHCWAEQTSQTMQAALGKQIASILEASKYDRSTAGVTDTYGKKWLP